MPALEETVDFYLQPRNHPKLQAFISACMKELLDPNQLLGEEPCPVWNAPIDVDVPNMKNEKQKLSKSAGFKKMMENTANKIRYINHNIIYSGRHLILQYSAFWIRQDFYLLILRC